MPTAPGWTADPFETAVERRPDGSTLLIPRAQMAPMPARMMDELERWAVIAPERVCVARRGASGSWIELSYREVRERVQRIAAALLTRNLSADRPLVILSGNSIEHLLLGWGAIWAGIPYCPVSPSYSQMSADLQKLDFVYELLTPGMVAAFPTRSFNRALQKAPVDAELLGDYSEAGGRVVTLFDALDADPSPQLASQLAGVHARTGGESIVRFLLTSGSTGQPKAVVVTDRMVCSNAMMVAQALPFLRTEPPVLVDWLPWNHTFGGSHNIGLFLFHGGTLYMDDGKPTPLGFAETIRNLREISPTVYFNVPKGFEMLAHPLREDAALRQAFYRRLRACFFAGAGLSQHTWDAFDELSVLERGQPVPMLSGLGATETGPSVTFTTPEGGRAGSIGLPAAGNVVKLAPVGTKTEIRVRGPNVTPGYWRRPDLTEKAFDDEGFYRLGDAVRSIDPQDPTSGLRFDGRIAEDFKLASGTWVSVGPLRSSLIAALSPLIQDVVITGLNQEFIGALLIPDLQACGTFLQLSRPPTYDLLTPSASLREALQRRLYEHAANQPGSSTRVVRAMLLPSAPSLDAGEITDKGSINQRAVLDRRAGEVAALHGNAPSHGVIQVT